MSASKPGRAHRRLPKSVLQVRAIATRPRVGFQLDEVYAREMIAYPVALLALVLGIGVVTLVTLSI
jgi:hypothetical protein